MTPKPISLMNIPLESDYSWRTVYIKGNPDPLKYKKLPQSKNELLILPNRIYRYTGVLNSSDICDPEHRIVHRNDEPAMIIEDYVFQNDKAIKIGKSEHWFVNGQRHRHDGPAKIAYDGNGEVIDHEWFIAGNLLRDVDKWISQIKLPPWQEWTNSEKTFFKLKFIGS